MGISWDDPLLMKYLTMKPIVKNKKVRYKLCLIPGTYKIYTIAKVNIDKLYHWTDGFQDPDKILQGTSV